MDMSDANTIVKKIKDEDIKFLDLRFTDPRGKMQHVTMDTSVVDEEMFADGVMFDGSSIAGWKAINESDMNLSLDPGSAHMDPFFAQSTMAIFATFSTRQPASLTTVTLAVQRRRPKHT